MSPYMAYMDPMGYDVENNWHGYGITKPTRPWQIKSWWNHMGKITIFFWVKSIVMSVGEIPNTCCAYTCPLFLKDTCRGVLKMEVPCGTPSHHSFQLEHEFLPCSELGIPPWLCGNPHFAGWNSAFSCCSPSRVLKAPPVGSALTATMRAAGPGSGVSQGFGPQKLCFRSLAPTTVEEIQHQLATIDNSETL